MKPSSVPLPVETRSTRLYALMLVPIFIGSLIGFALSTWVRAQMGIWSLFPVAILKKLFPGEEGHKVPGYDRIISWHALFACVWMFVCMLQLASAVSTACWARRIHRFAGKFVGPTSLIAMTPLWVLAMWKNTDYQGEVKVLAYMIVSFESALILVNVYCGLRCILDPKNKISAKSKSEAIEKHKAYMFFAILWSMAPGYDRFCMACVLRPDASPAVLHRLQGRSDWRVCEQRATGGRHARHPQARRDPERKACAPQRVLGAHSHRSDGVRDGRQYGRQGAGLPGVGIDHLSLSVRTPGVPAKVVETFFILGEHDFIIGIFKVSHESPLKVPTLSTIRPKRHIH